MACDAVAWVWEDYVSVLYIAEKPSVARAVAHELGLSGTRCDGYILCDNDVRVTWCLGHMFEQAMPDEYTPDDVPRTKTGTKRWRVEDLPILPEKWIMTQRKEARQQLKIILGLLKEASEVVHAGDPDREGQLLVDEVLEHAKFKKPVKRFWVSSQDVESIRKGLENQRDNKLYAGWRDSARARSRADWLVGMNLSRAYSLRAGRGNSSGKFVVGRVKSPTLCMVVARDHEIEHFSPKNYFVVKARIEHSNGSFLGTWKAPEDYAGIDQDGALIDEAIAKGVVDAVGNQAGKVLEFQTKEKTQGAPLGYSLAGITLEASKKFGFSAEKVLEICQKLYEARLTSYPRTDCSYLPESQHADAAEVIAAVNSNIGQYKTLKVDPSLKSKVWNDKKVTAHHAIIPTKHTGSEARALDTDAAGIYHLIVQRYFAQFLPEHKYLATTVKVGVAGHDFCASGKVIIENGWKDIIKEFDEDEPGKPEKEDDDQDQSLPQMCDEDPIICQDASYVAKKTKPPQRYNEGTLIRDMEMVHRVVADPEHKKALRDSDGIGTPATRATLIKELRENGYLEVKGKNIVSTDIGRQIAAELPDDIKSPVLTAINERKLKEIERCENEVESIRLMEEFLRMVTDMVRLHVDAANDGSCLIGDPREANPKPSVVVSDQYVCQACGKGLVKRVSAKGHPWWGCSGFPVCSERYYDKDGAPIFK